MMEPKSELLPRFEVVVRPSRPVAFLVPVKLLGYALTLDSDKKEIIFDPLTVTVNFFGKLTGNGVGVPNEKIGVRVCSEGDCKDIPPEETGVVTDGEGNYGFSADFNLTTHVPTDIDLHWEFQTFTPRVESNRLGILMPLRYCMGLGGVVIDPVMVLLSLLGGLAPVVCVVGVVATNEVQKAVTHVVTTTI